MCVLSQIALSRMGRHIPYALLSGQEVIVGVKAYLDRSGQAASRYVTLAAFAGPDVEWAQFEKGWAETLRTGFLPVDYFHVREALGRHEKSPFSWKRGWERTHVWNLLGKLIVYIGQNFNRGRLTMHSCVIDMDAWRELTSQGIRLPSDVELCNRYVSQYIVFLFAKKVLKEAQTRNMPDTFFMHPDDLLSFIFDRGEDYLEHFRQFVNREKATGDGTMWHLVDGVGERDMRYTPGLQAADIFAWGINRENTKNEGEEGTHVAHILRQVVASFAKEYDRDTLLREFGPSLP